MKISKTFIALLAIFVAVSCTKNPFTGKQNLALVPNSQLFPMAFQEYDDFKSEHKVITGTKDAQMVKKVGRKIAHAAQQYLNANGYKGYLKNYKWEYNLVQDKAVNAWCMPGGKIVVYTGILPITQDEAGLAVVLGHEVAHALANHGQRKMSQAQLEQLGAVAGNVALQNNSKGQQLFNAAYGIGTQIGISLPYSRKFESQADKIGLKLMAIAGYDPEVAVQLWQRMSQQSNGQSPPEFLSTHPSNARRIADIQKEVPNAKAAGRKYGVTSFQR